MIGLTYGQLTVLSIHGKRWSDVAFHCRCSCGNHTLAQKHRLLTGRSKSCGCRRASGIGACQPTHRLSQSRESIVWSSMKARCYNRKNKSFARYGGRGIVVCDRWRDSFENFFADMGRRPSARHSIDRTNNDGPYAPDNCYWGTVVTQANNRRTSHILVLNGISRTVAQWATVIGLPPATLYARVNKLGWSHARALTTPLRRWLSESTT